MGLDMYLTKKTFIWEGNGQNKIQLPEELQSIKRERICYIEEEIGYWRKSNMIHQWFVNNVQEGNDNCGYYYVSLEQMEELLGLVNSVLEDHSKASDILPRQSGFFFGSTQYDEDYFLDLEDTKKILENAIAEEDGEYYYHSSW